MVNWNDQVRDTLWSEHKIIDDHIVPQQKECNGNHFSKFGRCAKKYRHEDECNTVSSTIKAKNEFFSFNVKYNSANNINQESIDMDAWPDLPNLSMTYGGGFNNGIVRDSVVAGLLSDVDDDSCMKSVGGYKEGHSNSSVLLHDKVSSSLSKGSILLSVNDMQLDGQPDLFGYDNQNDNFVDYTWANIEDFVDLDKMFTNNNSLFGNAMIDNNDAFLIASEDLISSTSHSIPVPDLLISGDQTLEEVSYQLNEQPIVKANPMPKRKTESQNQTVRTRKNGGEKNSSSHDLNDSCHNKNLQITNSTSSLNPMHAPQSQSIEQPSSSPHLMFADHGYPAHQFHGLPLLSGENQHKSAYSDFSKHRKVEATSMPVTMTPKEKIEKLRRRQQMQAMLAIQKQREQYDHQISCSDVTEHSQKLASSDGSSLSEQDQSQMISSSSLNGHSVEEAIYYQLHDAMGKLDMNVRLSIRDSLYRLANSAMERQNVRDESSTNKNKEDDEISADDESNKDRYSRQSDSEAVTNPIDRIVAHLLFHNPSSSTLMPIADGDISMATSI